MDIGRPRARTLIVAASLALTAADRPILPLAEARWVPEAALEETLIRRPRECLRPPASAAARRTLAVGRAAFAAPLLLGGQAARAGLSCDSCHRNGRGNPVFLFPGLSGAPGTADVTSSLMSAHRGDGTHNPVPIPDLASAHPKVSRDPGKDELRRFIRGLIVEEFDGREPASSVLDALTFYVRSIDPARCKAGSEPITLQGELARVEEATAAARAALDAGDAAAALIALSSARSRLGAIDPRFRLSGLEMSREALARGGRELGALEGQVRNRDPRAPAAIGLWLDTGLPRIAKVLAKERDRSFFAPAVLRGELAARR